MAVLPQSKRTKILLLVVILVAAIFVASGVFWRRVYSRPENVFNRMLENALTTTSVAKHSLVEGEGQRIEQVTDLFTAPEPLIHGTVDISQQGEESSSVKRETITTSSETFIRLVSVETTQKNSTGKPFDFSSITGIWGRSPAEEGSNSLSQLYGQNVAVPFANLSVPQRSQLLGQIRQDSVYEVDYAQAKSAKKGGRLVYDFPVSVKPEAFIKMMKTLGGLVGVAGFDQVNSNDYKNLPNVKFTFSVDVLSGDLINVDYGNGQTEDYSGYGIRTLPRHPEDAISTFELQNRLQNLQR